MWFFEIAILEITIRFFKFVWEILPIQPTIQTREKISTPSFSRRWEHFSKIGLRGCTSTVIYGATIEADFRKMFSSSRKRGGADFFPGLYGGLYGQNLPYKFKKSYGDVQKRNFEKSHRTTGPRSDLRPDSWSWANFGLDRTSRIFENEIFWVVLKYSP